LTPAMPGIQFLSTMNKTRITARYLRKRFAKARKLAVDYWARLNPYQPHPLTEAEARALHDENRGDR
jgi:hypothetical protein